MAELLFFWDGIQNGFWAFGQNLTEYRKHINCLTLSANGVLDKKVSRQEIDEIYTNLDGQKKLKIYQNTVHQNYLKKYKNK